MCRHADTLLRFDKKQTPELAIQMKTVVVPLAFLAAFWLALSGYYTGLLLGFGAISCAFVCFLALRMDIADQEGHPVYLVSWRIIPYLGWLIKEILSSSVTVARFALSPKLRIEPAVAALDARQMNEVEKVLYANSITLTPGTLTLDVADDRLIVHTVQHDLLNALKRGEMASKVLKTTIHPKAK